MGASHAAASPAALEAEVARVEAKAARAEAEATRAEAEAARAKVPAVAQLLSEEARSLVYSLPPLGPSKRALVLGMGGGCDVFAAFAIAQLWSEQESCHESAVVLYGNAVSPVLDTMQNNDHPILLPNVLYSCETDVKPLRQGDGGYGTTALEQSVPRGPEGSPLLVVVPRKSGALEEVSAVNCDSIHAALRRLKVDAIVCVDCGGDSLTGGRNFIVHPELGRDRQVLRACRESGIFCIHLVLGPGCDGESSAEELRKSVAELHRQGSYLGAWDRFPSAAHSLAELAKDLAPNRTPNIIARAFSQEAVGAVGGEQFAASAGELCTVDRWGRSVEIPYAWLRTALAFRVDGRHIAVEPPPSKQGKKPTAEEVRLGLGQFDEPLYGAVEGRQIRVLDAAWLCARPASWTLLCRQQLEALEGEGEQPYLDSAHVLACMKTEYRRIGVVSYGWASAGAPDPDGSRLAAIIKFLRANSESFDGVWWDVCAGWSRPRPWHSG